MERIYKATDADNERPDRQQLDAHFAYWNVSTLHASTSIDKKKAPSDTAVLDKSFLSGPFSFFLLQDTRVLRRVLQYKGEIIARPTRVLVVSVSRGNGILEDH